MVKRNSEHRKDVAEAMFGGKGEVQFTRIAETPEDLYGKGRVFSVVTLSPCLTPPHSGYPQTPPTPRPPRSLPHPLSAS